MIYKFHTTPMKHQVEGLKKVNVVGHLGLFMEMGTGKSKVAIDFCCAKHLSGEVNKVLIVCPKSVKSVWPREIKKHAPSHLAEGIEWRITNYDRIADKNREDGSLMPGEIKELLKWGPDVVIADESHRIKNPQAKRTRAMIRLGKVAKFKLCLTGTPITKHPFDIFSQFIFLEGGDTFGTSYTRFKKKYGLWGGYQGYELLRYVNLKDLKKKADPHIFLARKDDCLDLPPRRHEVIPVEMTGKARVIYDKLAKNSIVKFSDGGVAEAGNVLTRILMLHQLTGGYIKVEDQYKHVDDSKYLVFKDLVEDMFGNDRKIVVFVKFLNELRDAKKACEAVGYKVLSIHGRVSESKRERSLAVFDETSKPTAFVIQTDSGSEGISLTAASEAIFYSHTNNFASYAQACDRLHRKGQHHPVTYYHLLTQRTVDEAIYLALRMKKDVADLVLRHPELLLAKRLEEAEESG